MTQVQVANLLHVSRKTISGWENSHSLPDISSLIKLSQVYEISLDDLLQADHVVDDREVQKTQHNAKVARITYNLNLVFCILAYFEFFDFKSPHIPIVFSLLVTNLIIYLFHFSNWELSKKRLLVFTSSFLLLFGLNIILNIVLVGSSNFIAHADPYFIFGFSLGRLLSSLGVTCSLEVILFFRPQK